MSTNISNDCGISAVESVVGVGFGGSNEGKMKSTKDKSKFSNSNQKSSNSHGTEGFGSILNNCLK